MDRNGFGLQKKDAQKDVVEVPAVVIYEESSSSKASNEHLDLLEQIINAKDHLKRNIVDLKLSRSKSRKLSNSVLFTHELPVVFKVNVLSLWESAQSYLIKHLGSSQWTMPDGTKVSSRRLDEE